MRMLAIVGALFVMLGFATSANAVCECACANGQPVTICQRGTDAKPVCGPEICKKPLAAPQASGGDIPPPNTDKCQLVRVHNPITTQNEWKKVCP